MKREFKQLSTKETKSVKGGRKRRQRTEEELMDAGLVVCPPPDPED